MSVWGIRFDWRYEPYEITKETAQCVFYKQARWGSEQERRTDKGKFLDWRGTEERARRLSEQLTSARAERDRRVAAANLWLDRRALELTRDSDRDREADETRSGSVPEGDRARAEGIAQPSDPSSPPSSSRIP